MQRGLTEPLVRATGLSKSYTLAGTEIVALAGVSLEVRAGEAVDVYFMPELTSWKLWYSTAR